MIKKTTPSILIEQQQQNHNKINNKNSSAKITKLTDTTGKNSGDPV